MQQDNTRRGKVESFSPVEEHIPPPEEEISGKKEKETITGKIAKENMDTALWWSVCHWLLHLSRQFITLRRSVPILLLRLELEVETAAVKTLLDVNMRKR